MPSVGTISNLKDEKTKTKRFKDLPRVTELISSGDRIQTQADWSKAWTLHHHATFKLSERQE